MKSKLVKIFFLLCLTGFFSPVMSQNVITITGTKTVLGGESLVIPAGSTVVFEPGATLNIEGGLEVNGNAEVPVLFISKDPNHPGRGLQITGWDQNTAVNLSYAKFEGLLQPLRFDPFWYRKSVSLNQIGIKNSRSEEPIIYVASPLKDLSDVKNVISFKINGLNAVNNNSGVILESFNSEGLIYELNNIRFLDNNLKGTDETAGVLILNLEAGSSTSTGRIGKLLFLRNFADKNPIGLTVSGSANQQLAIEKFFQMDSSRLIYDQFKDPRIPLVSTEITNDLDAFGISNYFKTIVHNFGSVITIPRGNMEFVEIRDSLGRKIDFTLVRNSDTQFYNYLQGIPAVGLANDGTQVRIPSFSFDTISRIFLTKIDTAEYFEYLRQKSRKEQFAGSGLGKVADILGEQLGINESNAKNKSIYVDRAKQWEIGMWYGGSIYGGGDLRHKFAPLPSTIEHSRGLYGQYNINKRLSAKITGYYSSVSMHNIYAPGVFSGMKPPRVYNALKPGDDILIFKTLTWPINFYTRMFILEGEGLWHILPYGIKQGKKYSIVPTLGVSVGAFHYTPYRFTWTYKQDDENYFAFRKRLYSDHMYNLRKVGSEGQNFLPGADQYSTLALNLGSSFSLTYLRKKWAFKGEMKAVYTSTDYLDDFGPGFWYGGNLQAVRDNVKIDDFRIPSDLQFITPTDTRLAPYSMRSTNGLNDWYYQLHLGVSYDITGFSFNKKKKLKSTITPAF